LAQDTEWEQGEKELLGYVEMRDGGLMALPRHATQVSHPDL